MHQPPAKPQSDLSNPKPLSAANPPGRPRALDELKRREICAMVAAGGGLEAAAHYVGCSLVTIRREAVRDPEFFAQLRQAQFESQLSPLKTVQKAAATHWRAAAWYLERTQPNRFTPKPRDCWTKEEVEQLAELIAGTVIDQIDDIETAERVLEAIADVAQKYALEHRALKLMFRDVHPRHQRMLASKAEREQLSAAPPPRDVA